VYIPTCPSRRVPLTPHTALRRTWCLLLGLALCTTEVRPPRRGIELRASVKLHWGGQQVDEHKFQPYVSCVLNVCSICFIWICKSRFGVAYVAMTIHVCCKCMFQMFQLFQTDIVSVLSGCCICCTGSTRMLQVYVLNVSSVSNVCCKCFI
jgi:hypothetical protein